jgi:hypothetical protein
MCHPTPKFIFINLDTKFRPIFQADTILLTKSNLIKAYRLILDTEGAFSCEQTPSWMSFSRISHANMFGLRVLYEAIDSITDMVATFGFEPPISPGLIEPVELNLKWAEKGMKLMMSSIKQIKNMYRMRTW